METEIMTKEVFLEMIDKSMKDNEVIILTSRLGDVKVLSQKKQNYAKSYTAIYPNNIFKNQDSIADLLNCKLLGVVVCESKFLNDKLQEQFREVRHGKKK